VVSRLLQLNGSKATLDLCCWQRDVTTSSLLSSLSGCGLLACFFPLLFVGPCTLIAEKKNTTFWTPVKSTRTLTLEISEIFYESKEQRKAQ